MGEKKSSKNSLSRIKKEKNTKQLVSKVNKKNSKVPGKKKRKTLCSKLVPNSLTCKSERGGGEYQLKEGKQQVETQKSIQ